jgi:moderate conductance mechanosensitive channel
VARALILTIMVTALTVFLVRISQQGLDRLFKVSDELKNNYPDLEARANRYLPLLRQTVKGILYIIGAFSIMQAWESAPSAGSCRPREVPLFPNCW